MSGNFYDPISRSFVFPSQRTERDSVGSLVVGGATHSITHSINSSGHYVVADDSGVSLLKFDTNGNVLSSKLTDHIQSQVGAVSSVVTGHTAAIAAHTTSINSHASTLSAHDAALSALSGTDGSVGEIITDLQNRIQVLETYNTDLRALILQLSKTFAWDDEFDFSNLL